MDKLIHTQAYTPHIRACMQVWKITSGSKGNEMVTWLADSKHMYSALLFQKGAEVSIISGL